jgi:uncharacterized protein
MQHFGDIMFSEAACERQRARGSFEHYSTAAHHDAPASLGDAEIDFLTDRDSFYLASVGPDGWPYVQHRGGPAGFVKVLGPTRIAWVDRSGNQQFISAGNLDADGRISIIAVDYPARRRLKLLGRARFVTQPDGALLAALGLDGRYEGVVVVDVVAFDWNCPKHITPRFTAAQVESLVASLTDRIAKLERQIALATAS